MGHLLDQIRSEPDGYLYPRERLLGLHTALIGFSAGFLGRQDAVWVAEAGLTATCVDTNPERLVEMSLAYPEDWTFTCDDMYEYAGRRYAEGTTYDLVSLDPYTNQFQECADEIDLWCALADKLVVIGTGDSTVLEVPEDWEIMTTTRRSNYQGGTYWVTMEPV